IQSTLGVALHRIPFGPILHNVDIDFRAAYALDLPAIQPEFDVYDNDHAPVGVGGDVRGVAIQAPPLTVTDASGDDSLSTVFEGGAIRVRYDLSSVPGVTSAVSEAVRAGTTIPLHTFADPAGSGRLVALDPSVPGGVNLDPGVYMVRACATVNGRTIYSAAQ